MTGNSHFHLRILYLQSQMKINGLHNLRSGDATLLCIHSPIKGPRMPAWSHRHYRQLLHLAVSHYLVCDWAFCAFVECTEPLHAMNAFSWLLFSASPPFPSSSPIHSFILSSLLSPYLTVPFPAFLSSPPLLLLSSSALPLLSSLSSSTPPLVSSSFTLLPISSEGGTGISPFELNKILIGAGVASLLLIVVVVTILEGLCCYYCCAPTKVKMPAVDDYELDLARGFRIKEAKEFDYSMSRERT